MQKRWLIKITGKRRAEADIDLVMQAVIALWQQLRDERHAANKKLDNGDTSDAMPAHDATEGTV